MEQKAEVIQSRLIVQQKKTIKALNIIRGLEGTSEILPEMKNTLRYIYTYKLYQTFSSFFRKKRIKLAQNYNK